ncbi:MAG: exodeoxyribonuclease VII large subunit [Candidatus Puniceispirillum sp.]|nr:exodeoxyribonuclease VII large subunit [Candidatus Pelagibacter sp.]MBA4282939.1 exodeoxyribonuclease VII large subunit [Candidatus Puniceispirillum sp.]
MTFALKEKENVYTVSSLSFALKKCVEERFFRVKIQGEISGFKKHSSGHSYFALKDADALIDAVMWRGTAVAFAPSDGLSVYATGRITTYPGRSKYQIVVDGLELFGKGDLFNLFLERRKKFEELGYFKQKRLLPKYVQRIGVITSPTGAVIQDILHRIQDRYPCEVLLWPANVQGATSAQELSAAVKGMNALPQYMRPDVIIIARGGGSFEDLWSFNDEGLIDALYQSAIPTVSAVGHETDFTLCDYVCDMRAPTPTGAAEIVTPHRFELKQRLQNFHTILDNYMGRVLQIAKLKLEHFNRGLDRPKFAVEAYMIKLDDLTERLNRVMTNTVLNKQRLIPLLSSQTTLNALTSLEQRLKHFSQNLAYTMNSQIKDYGTSLDQISSRLQQADYHQTLKRGFCLIKADKHLVSSVSDVQSLASDKQLQLEFFDGSVDVKIEVV